VRGVAFIPAILILSALALAGGLTLGVFSQPGSQAPNETAPEGPVAIATNAGANIPWADLYDLFFGGVFGVMIWVSRYLILPLMNWAATTAAGRSITFDIFWAYLVLVLIALFIVWNKKEHIYSFLTTNLIRVGAIVGAVFLVGLVLRFMGAI
jgi:hypothetical protein